MSIDLLTHQPNCSPVQPCASCQAMAWLRANLTRDKLSQFVAILQQAGSSSLSATASIMELRLPTITSNALLNDNTDTIEKLVSKSSQELLRIPNLGRNGLQKIREALSDRGMRLADST